MLYQSVSLAAPVKFKTGSLNIMKTKKLKLLVKHNLFRWQLWAAPGPYDILQQGLYQQTATAQKDDFGIEVS